MLLELRKSLRKGLTHYNCICGPIRDSYLWNNFCLAIARPQFKLGEFYGFIEYR